MVAIADDAVLAVAPVVAVFGLVVRCMKRDAEHGEAARPAGEQAAQQVVVAGVVAERQCRVPPQLLQRLLMGLFVDEGGDGDADPLLTRAWSAARVLVGAAGVTGAAAAERRRSGWCRLCRYRLGQRGCGARRR